MGIKKLSIKSQLIVFLGLFSIYLCIVEKDITFLTSIIITVVSAAIFDAVITYIKTKKFLITESSIITGLIIGFVISSDNTAWINISACLLAIGSKHLIRINSRHIFNPAAFGVFAAILFLNAFTQWKGTYHWYVLVPFGLYFIWKIGKIELLLGYALTSLCLFGAQAIFQKAPLAGIWGYFSYFYIFIMVIEPKTTPVRPLPKFIFGVIVAALVFLLTNIGVKFDAELCSLLIANTTVLFLKKIGA